MEIAFEPLGDPNTLSPAKDGGVAKNRVYSEIRDFISQKNYPCIAALKALQRKEIRLGVYHDFGAGESWMPLRDDLFGFLQEQKKSASEYLTFWAVFEGEAEFSENEFEEALWRELSSLTSTEDKNSDWGANNSDPEKSEFTFCLFGEAFFVVGLHSGSSRPGRRFSRPSLVFNIFQQFEAIEQKGLYESMVRTNRERDLKFSGTVNPIVKKYGDKWEAIQFSGKDNPEQWECPFHFKQKSEK